MGPQLTIFNWTVRRLRGWCAVTFFPSVDLQELCDSHHDEGGMGLPRELIDEIMRYNDLQTLKSCSLTSRTLYSAARPLIHKQLVLGLNSTHYLSYVTYDRVCHTNYLSAAEGKGLLRYGYVRELDLDFCIENPEDILQLKQLRALKTVDTLTIRSMALPALVSPSSPFFHHSFAVSSTPPLSITLSMSI